MTYEEFRSSLKEDQEPDLDPFLHALWIEAKGDWDGAHETVQVIEDVKAYRIHAYLHRKEGDLSNAGYWYNRAGLKKETGPLDSEWGALVREFL